jgi:hypothetical protein
MKTIPHSSYRILFLVLLIPYLSLAQSQRQTKESFTVGDNPVISLDLSHAEIIVKTWNKDKVEVKTTLSSETLSQDEADKIFDNQPITVIGNSQGVKISSIPSSIRKFKRMAPKKLPAPPRPPQPRSPKMTPPSPPSLPTPPEMPFQFNFDYLEFKKEGKAYLEKFKKQIESTNFKEEMQDFRKAMKAWRKEIGDEREEWMQLRDSTLNYVQALKPKMDSLFKNRGDRRRNSVSNSIKKLIEIRIPESASFEIDLRHSTLDAESMENLMANLRYSELSIQNITGDTAEIKSDYSTVDVESVNKLKLELVYSKTVNIGSVNQLNVKSKMSQLTIEALKQQAIIQGSYGKLAINDVDPGFSLIDIQLQKSTADLILPKSDYNFYAKSTNSKFNIMSDIDLKMTKNFDDVIYTQSNSRDTSQKVNLSLDYSTLNLN